MGEIQNTEDRAGKVWALKKPAHGWLSQVKPTLKIGYLLWTFVQKVDHIDKDVTGFRE
ncbi:hypothetical protein GCM10027217_33020 [Pseudomaricurvus hydrocarbonicus]